MIDKSSISIESVLKFPRAKAVRDELVTNSILTTPKSIDALKKILNLHTASACLHPWAWCNNDIQKLHHEFQFQRLSVEGSLSQKIVQVAKQLITSRGLPDELTMILGSFNLFAAVSRAVIYQAGAHTFADVTHI